MKEAQGIIGEIFPEDSQVGKKDSERGFVQKSLENEYNKLGNHPSSEDFSACV